jgi:hypothetical protein
MVGMPRCGVPARAAAGRTVRNPSAFSTSYVCAAGTRRGRRSAASLPNLVRVPGYALEGFIFCVAPQASRSKLCPSEAVHPKPTV